MYYGFAIIDGEVEEVSGYKVENPTLFKGRGKHPKSGHFKSKIKP
jgi:DNA topoisomerase-1